MIKHYKTTLEIHEDFPQLDNIDYDSLYMFVQALNGNMEDYSAKNIKLRIVFNCEWGWIKPVLEMWTTEDTINYDSINAYIQITNIILKHPNLSFINPIITYGIFGWKVDTEPLNIVLLPIKENCTWWDENGNIVKE